MCVHLSVYYRTTLENIQTYGCTHADSIAGATFRGNFLAGGAYLTHGSVGSGHGHGRFVAVSSS